MSRAAAPDPGWRKEMDRLQEELRWLRRDLERAQDEAVRVREEKKRIRGEMARVQEEIARARRWRDEAQESKALGDRREAVRRDERGRFSGADAGADEPPIDYDYDYGADSRP